MPDLMSIYDAYPAKSAAGRPCSRSSARFAGCKRASADKSSPTKEATAGLLKATTALLVSPAGSISLRTYPATFFHQSRYLDDETE